MDKLILVRGKIGDVLVWAQFDGVLRGILPDGYPVRKNMKMADIDPRKSELKNCYTISDKARNLAGSGLEALLCLAREKRILEIMAQ